MLSDGTLLVAGGIGRNSFERINLVSATSTLLAVRLPTTLDDLAMAPLPDGRIWIIAGQSFDGSTTDRTWFLTLKPGGESELTDGPPLGLAAGVADHVVIQTGQGLAVIGGESQNRVKDTELASAFWLDPSRLTVTRLPDTPIAHDDAAGFFDGRGPIVVGGQVKAPFLGVPVPTPIRAVHRLHIEAVQ